MTEDSASRRLAHSAYRQLEDMIFSGKLRGGDVVIERRLAEMLNISRTPLRDALLMLEGEGLLKRRGARYLEVSEMTVPEFMQILNIRRLLEPEAARLCIGRIDPMLLADLRDRLRRLAAATGENQPVSDPDESVLIDKLVHESIADASGNPLMSNIIRDLRRRTRIFDLGRMTDRVSAACQEHIDIVVAIEIGDPHAAAAAMARHIDNFKAAIIQHLSSF
ncbi:GntR family transcriptional regulator [Ancylobacter sp. A5.8]|uniref:GntR family transcriptional regulator n=1 Tax=Ancylobacter gelatini TaxID=2919920 RepID=UPI001F4DDF56|nr:GntR family transcriptional regulator [Ancylobacter gelatini]MCJ8142854.1 GntR family transcriptional regulator [Ancylobacter gelatini]